MSMRVEDKHPPCVTLIEYGGKRMYIREPDREEGPDGSVRTDETKRGSGMKEREDRPREMETLITEVLAKIKPTEHFRLVKQTSRKNRN
jgi:hypothetical protein